MKSLWAIILCLVAVMTAGTGCRKNYGYQPDNYGYHGDSYVKTHVVRHDVVVPGNYGQRGPQTVPQYLEQRERQHQRQMRQGHHRPQGEKRADKNRHGNR
jgi:hypothetical protein